MTKMKYLTVSALLLTAMPGAVHADALSRALNDILSARAESTDTGCDVCGIEKGEPGYSNGMTGAAEVSEDGSVTETGCDASCDAAADEARDGKPGTK